MAGKSTRVGTYKCYQCRKPFIVKIGTIFKSTHWLRNEGFVSPDLLGSACEYAANGYPIFPLNGKKVLHPTKKSNRELSAWNMEVNMSTSPELTLPSAGYRIRTRLLLMNWFSDAVYVHVGLHKTATSWLQDHYFTQNDHFWIPSVESTHKRPIKEIGHWVIGNKSNTYWMYDEFNLLYYKSKLSEISKPSNLLPIISNERMSGHPFSGGFDRKSIATRIKSLFPKARIIVTIRDQNSLIFSEYMQYLRKGGWQSPELFLRPPTDDRQPCLLLSFWDYHQIYLLYSSMFGAENVLFLPQEILRTNPDDFFAMISKFCGFNQSQSFNTAEESNPRRPILPSYLLRKIGHLQKKSSENAFRPSILPTNIEPVCYWTLFYAIRSLFGNNMDSYLEKKLKNRINNVIGDTFVSSNRRFASDSGLNLSDLGYAI